MAYTYLSGYASANTLAQINVSARTFSLKQFNKMFLFDQRQISFFIQTREHEAFFFLNITHIHRLSADEVNKLVFFPNSWETAFVGDTVFVVGEQVSVIGL